MNKNIGDGEEPEQLVDMASELLKAFSGWLPQGSTVLFFVILVTIDISFKYRPTDLVLENHSTVHQLMRR